MANSNFSNLFNLKSSVQEPQSVRNSDEYKVSYKDGKGGVYESIIRFVPYYVDPEHSIKEKVVSWVKNPITQQAIYVDDPRTIGQPSPVIDMFFKFRNTNVAAYQEFGKNHFSSKPQYTALVQIIQDNQHPELVGQIKVFRFGKKIWDKLYAEEHPAMGQGVVPCHPVYGRYFHIKCVGQSGFNNFDQSNFFDNKAADNTVLPMGIWYVNPTTNQYETVTENTNQELVYNYLQANSPDLEKYEYHAWTSEQEKFINDVLNIAANYLQTGTLQSNLAAVNTAPGLNYNNNPVFPGATSPAPVSAIPTQMPGVPSSPVSPVMPAAPVAPSAPVMPAMPAAPVAPTMQPVAPQVPNMGAFQMGQPSLGGIPTPTVAPATISGIEIPKVEPAVAPSTGVANLGGVIGNVDDVLSQL